MKTLMNQLKFATLLTGFIFLSSCTGDATTDSELGNITSLKESPANVVKGNDDNIQNHSYDFSNGSLSKNNQMAVLIKLQVHPNHIITAFPISFGTSDATLISN